MASQEGWGVAEVTCGRGGRGSQEEGGGNKVTRATGGSPREGSEIAKLNGGGGKREEGGSKVIRWRGSFPAGRVRRVVATLHGKGRLPRRDGNGVEGGGG